jgi:DNA-binding GntR family transcriptional regulator
VTTVTVDPELMRRPEPAGTHLAYERIRQAIVEGRYRPGHRLVEQRVGQDLDLSRTPVREALFRLEAEGLVESVRNRGATVRTLTRQDILDVYDLRASLEALAAERAADRATDERIASLEDANDEFRKAIPLVAPDDLGGLRLLHAANDRFHAGLVALSGNRRLEQNLARTVSAPLVFISFRQYTTDELQRSMLFHELILQAVARHDGRRASALMAEHIYLGRDSLLAHLDPSEVTSLHPSVPDADALGSAR